MFILKLIRKTGKMLRGGAGKKEIFLGALCGVLIGFNPVAGMTLALAILITLLLNANIGFTLLGAAVGKLLSILLSMVSFHTGYFIIHNMGLEGLFTKLTNAPFTALMDLDVYAMIGGLPFAIIIGIIFGKFISATVTKIREQMVKAGGHEKVGKAVGNKFSRFLMWLAFGKQKISTADVLVKESPLLRKSGLILVGSVVLIGLVFEFFLLDVAVKKGLQAGISAETGAEVNIDKAHLSLAGGKLELEGLQITDPDKPTHNLIRLDTLAADLSVGDLLRRTYTIDLLAGSTLQRDTLRDQPGAVYVKEKKAAEEEVAKDEKDGKSLEDYFSQAKDWKKYGQKAYDFLKERKSNGEAAAKGEKPKASKKTAVADAKKLGYLKAAADLVANRPAWLIREVKIDNVLLGGDFAPQLFQASEVSSHPELNGQPTGIVMTPVGGTEPTAKIVLRFDDPAALHELSAKLDGVAIGGAVKTSDSFPLNINEGKANISIAGKFSADELALPFTINVRDLKADVEEGKSVMGMDAATATQVFSSMETIELDGSLGGSLLSPRVKVDYDKLTANLRSAATAAGKKMLQDKADKEVEKLKGKAGEELDKVLKGEDAEELKSKAKDALRKLF